MALFLGVSVPIGCLDCKKLQARKLASLKVCTIQIVNHNKLGIVCTSPHSSLTPPSHVGNPSFESSIVIDSFV